MDLLSKTLANVHLRGSLLATLDFCAPWAVDFETAPSGAPTHYVVSGQAWLHREGEEPLLLKPGDLVMFPRWDRHVLRSTAEQTPVRLIRDVVRDNEGELWQPGHWLDRPLHIRIDGEGERTQIISLVFELDETAPHPLLLGLPRLIHFSGEDVQMAPWLQTVMGFLSTETATQQAGYAVVSSRLADLLFMQIIRSELLTRPDQVTGPLRGLVDPNLGTVLAAIHDDPGADWSLARMARQAGLSRSAFFDRFKALLATTPASYVRDMRMDIAAARLASGSRVKTIAADLGYATPYGFTNAFKQVHGVAPGRFKPTKDAS